MKKTRHFRSTHLLSSTLLLSGALTAGAALAQSAPPPAAGNATSLWNEGASPAAVQADAWFDQYKFRDGETLERLKLYYATLGTPHRNAHGAIDNAVLVLHWTDADGRTLLNSTYSQALFDGGRPLDARRYFLIFPDNVGYGQSSKPSDGLKAHSPTTTAGTSSTCRTSWSPRRWGSNISTRSSACRWAA